MVTDFTKNFHNSNATMRCTGAEKLGFTELRQKAGPFYNKNNFLLIYQSHLSKLDSTGEQDPSISLLLKKDRRVGVCGGGSKKVKKNPWRKQP